MTARNLTHDFTGLSTLLLGQAQPAQFQSANQTGYWWGSKCTTVGTCDASGSIRNNEYTAIPRTYTNGKNVMLYNWWAATAESFVYDDMVLGLGNNPPASDSVCPKGWKLPSMNDNNDSKSWINMATNYDYSAVSGTSIMFSKMPIASWGAGELNAGTGNYNTYSNVYAGYISSTVYEPGGAGRIQQNSATHTLTYGEAGMASGATVRCVKK